MSQQHYEIKLQDNLQEKKQYTLNQPIRQTLKRDFSNIFIKLRFAMIPSLREQGKKQLRKWDLWGPLVLSLLLSLTLSFRAGKSTEAITISIFVIMWVGSLVVWLNALFLGSNMSFFQSASLLGYCLFPLNIVSLITCLIGGILPAIIKLLLVIISFIWSTLSSISFVSQMVPSHKKKLALYPIGLFYVFLSWFVLIV